MLMLGPVQVCYPHELYGNGCHHRQPPATAGAVQITGMLLTIQRTAAAWSRAGLATYMNVAITDPLQQRGLLAFDDAELTQAGPEAAAVLANTVRASSATTERDTVDADLLAALQEGLLYVVAVSRNCSGENFSLVIKP
jgi:hypothetical protein